MSEPVFWWQQFEVPVAFWWLALVVVFVGWLAGLAAIFESRAGLAAIRRLQAIQRARQQQAEEFSDPPWLVELEHRRAALDGATPQVERLPQK